MSNLVEALRETSKSIEEADIPPEFRPKAFEILLKHVLGSTRPVLGASVLDQRTTQCEEASTNNLERLADKLNVSSDLISDYFSCDPDEGKVKLSLSTKQLPKNKSNGTQRIALLLAAANEMLLPVSRETPYSEVREWAAYYGCHDSTNFSKSLSRLDDKIKISGKGSKAAFTLKQAGWEEAANVMQELIS